jgi:predicted Na+-dependent transporter
VRAIAVAAVALNGLTLMQPVLHILRSGFDRATVKDAIEGSMKPIGLGLLLAALLT